MNLEEEVKMCKAEQDALQGRKRKVKHQYNTKLNDNVYLSEEGRRKLLRYGIFLLKGGYNANSE